MKASKQITYFLIPLILVALVGGVLSGYFLNRQRQAYGLVHTEIEPALEALRQTASAANTLVVALQRGLLTQQGAELSIPHTLAAAPLSRFNSYRTASKGLNPTPNLVANVATALDNLTKARDELLFVSRPGANAKEEAGLERKRQNAAEEVASVNEDLAGGISRLMEVHTAQLNLANAEAEDAGRMALLVLGGTVALVVLLGGIAFFVLRSTIGRRLHNLLHGLENREALVVDATEVGRISAYVNSMQAESQYMEQALHSLVETGGEPQAVFKLNDNFANGLTALGRKFKTATQTSQELDTELVKLKKNLVDKDLRLQEVESELQSLIPKMKAVENTLAIAELDADGKLLTADKVLTQLSGFSSEELKGRELVTADTIAGAEENVHDQVWDTVRAGETWYGVVENKAKDGHSYWLASALTALPGGGNGKNGNGISKTNGASGAARYLLAGYEISALKNSEDQLRSSLSVLHKDLDGYRQTISSLKSEQEGLIRTFDSQRQLENRLLKQQNALQELAKNADLKEGNVRESLRMVTRTTCTALNAGQAGLWLFSDEDTRLRCLDQYLKTGDQHRNGFELTQDQAGEFFKALRAEQVLSSPHAVGDARLAELASGYLKEQNISALIAAPIHLGGAVVGALLVEETTAPREWVQDEETFVVSVADLVSLALEQGNRRVVEAELRTTLEESQALEEELRQNAEEIEATNEEMRRTQAELKGQISALNNAAIVYETNLGGIITYANAEFGKTYGYAVKEVLGQNQSLLRSSVHSDIFFDHMNRAISAGKVWKGEVCNRKKDGSLIWTLLTLTPVIGVDGSPYKYIAVSLNIDAQKRQEEQIKSALSISLEQEELLRHNAEELEYANEEMRRTQIELAGQINALNNSSMVYETDMEGNITYANEELMDGMGFSREDLIGKRYTVFKSDRQPEATYQEQWRTVLSGYIWRGEQEIKGKNGAYHWVMATNTPVLDENGEPIKSINVLFDITAQKQQELRLRKQQAALLEVTSSPTVMEGHVEEALELIANVARESANVSRASVWLFEEAGKTLRCMAVSQDESISHVNDAKSLIHVEMYPNYFSHMEGERTIAAVDAVNDPRTKELAFTLFKPLAITSVLDTSIRSGAKMVGILSFEMREETRNWTLDEQSFAGSLADTIALVLEQKERMLTDKLKEANAELEEKNAQVLRQKTELEEQSTFLTDSIKYAKRIQQNILPSKEILEQYLQNYFIVYRPRDVVGGDFYWFAAQGTKQVIVVADGTGHGVPGAFLTLIGYLLLNQIVGEKNITRPADILYHLHIGVRTALKQDEEGSESRDGMDVAVCTFDTSTYIAEYAGANLPFNYYQDWELQVIKPNKYSIGGEQMEEERTFTNHEVPMKPGDAIYLYTDGFVDQMGGPEEKRFSTRRFRDLVLRTQHETMATQRALVNLEWKEWKDDREQLDDVTLFGMKV